MAKAVVREIAELVVIEKDAGVKASKKSLEMTGLGDMLRCPDCGCATDNLDFHWAHCPFQEKRLAVPRNAEVRCKRGI